MDKFFPKVSLLKLCNVVTKAHTTPNKPFMPFVQNLGGWIACEDRLPPDETEVLIMVKGIRRIGALFWDYPGHEDTYQPYKYWDDPDNDGMDWEWDDVTHWQYMPTALLIPDDEC